MSTRPLHEYETAHEGSWEVNMVGLVITILALGYYMNRCLGANATCSL